MNRSLMYLAMVVGSVAAAPFASASVVFSQPPIATLDNAVLSVAGARVASPFIAPSSAQMTGLSFWSYNENSSPLPMSATFELFAEAPGGGVGGALFNFSASFASLTSESTSSIFVNKYTYNLPMSQPLLAGSRYFVSVSGEQGSFLGWLDGASGETTYFSPGGGPFVPAENDGPTAFEILGGASAIPLPSGAAMGLAGLGVMAGMRRRRATV